MARTTTIKKPNARALGIVTTFLIISIQTAYPAFQASVRTGCRRLVPALQRQFSSQKSPTETFFHGSQDQRHRLRTILVPATVAVLFMANHRETSHCSATPPLGYDKDKRTAASFLEKIAENSDHGNETAQLLLSNNTELAHTRDKNGNTALHIAAAHKNESLVEALIAAGADVNARNYLKSTPLHDAVFPGNETCVRLLLDNGAYVDALNHNTLTPLMIAARKKGNFENVKLLVEHGANVCENGKLCVCGRSWENPLELNCQCRYVPASRFALAEDTLDVFNFLRDQESISNQRPTVPDIGPF